MAADAAREAEPGAVDRTDASVYAAAKRLGRDAVVDGLLNLADQRLAAEGPEALSMRRLANAAGSSTMVFYSAFGTKAGLLEALADREVEGWLDQAAMLSDPDPDAWLRATGGALMALAADRPHQRDLVLTIGTAEGRLRDALLTAIARVAKEAGLQDGEATELAEAVWAAWRSALHDPDRARSARVLNGVGLLWGAYLRGRRG